MTRGVILLAKNKLIKVLAGIMLFALGAGSLTSLWAQSGRDPFAPYVIEEPEIAQPESIDEKGSDDESPQKPPLERYPLSDYRLIGVLIGPKSGVVLIRTRERKDYYLQLSDKLGNSDGVIVSINAAGIVVAEGENQVTIPVRNKTVASDDNF